MTFKDMLVHVDGSESGQARLMLAMDLAQRHDAQLTALYVREYSIAQLRRVRTSELGLATSADKEKLEQALHQELDANARSLRTWIHDAARERDLEVEWHDLAGQARVIVPQHARYASVTIVGHDAAPRENLPDEYSFAETMLFTIGRPLIVVPSPEAVSRGMTSLGRHVAIAWNGSRASSRSLSDALPLIERAERVTVLYCNEMRGAHQGSLPIEDIRSHLELHSRHVDEMHLEVGGRRVGNALQAAAIKVGADVLVAGAHGRPSLWEKVLGTVTGELLSRTHMPLFMSY